MNMPLSKLTCDQFGLKAARMLLPLDLAACPLEIFPLANGFARPFDGEIILLHVLDCRTNGTGRDAQAMQCLERIRDDYLRPTVEASFRLRIGTPHEEILAEAKTTNVDLILLPTFAPSIWRRLTGAYYGETARNLIAGASCRVFVVDVRGRFNCFRQWAKGELCGQWAA